MQSIKLPFNLSYQLIYKENKLKKSKTIALNFRKFNPILSPYIVFYYKALPKLLSGDRFDFMVKSGFILTNPDVVLKKSMIEKIRNLKLI